MIEKEKVDRAQELAESVKIKVDGMQEEIDVGYWLQTSNMMELPASKTWTECAYHNGTFVLANSNNDNTIAYATSADGWKLAALPSSMACKCVCYGAGKFVTLGSGTNRGAYSEDGKKWHAFTLPSSGDWDCLAYGSGLFLALYDTTIVQSSDGVTWESYVGTYPLRQYYASFIRYCNDRFFISSGGQGTTYYSLDGMSWTATGPTTSDSTVRDICYGNGLYVIAGGNYAYQSNNCATWSSARLPITGGSGANGNYIAYGNGIYMILRASSNKAFISANASSWSEVDVLALGAPWGDVVFGGGFFSVLPGNSTAARYSRTGQSWDVTPGSSMLDSNGVDKTTEVMNALNGITTATLDAAYTAGVNAYQ